MHAITQHALRSSRLQCTRPACQTIAGVRRSQSKTFHRSAVAYRIPENAPDTTSSTANNEAKVAEGADSEPISEDKARANVASTSQFNDVLQRSRRRGERGSGIRRTQRHLETLAVPPLVIPDWFFERNVWCAGEKDDEKVRLEPDVPTDTHPVLSHTPLKISTSVVEMDALGEPLGEKEIKASDILKSVHETTIILEYAEVVLKEIKSRVESSQGPLAHSEHASGSPKSPFVVRKGEVVTSQDRAHKEEIVENQGRKVTSEKYNLDWFVYMEISYTIDANLALQPPKGNISDAIRPDTVLYCPRNDSSTYLDAVIRKVAWDKEYDVVKLDSSAIAQIIGEYLGENIAWKKSPASLLEYDLHMSSGYSGLLSKRELKRDEDEDDDNVFETEDTFPSFEPHLPGGKHGRSPRLATVAFLQSSPRFLVPQDHSKGMSLLNFFGQTAKSASGATHPASLGSDWLDYKLSRALDILVGAADTKRACDASKIRGGEQVSQEAISPEANGLIIQVDNYKELSEHPVGSVILDKLRETVKRSWFEGRRVAIVGTAADADLKYETRSSIGQDEVDSVIDRPRIIFVPPSRNDAQDTLFLDDGKRRVRELNIRHLQDMIRNLSGDIGNAQLVVDLPEDLPDLSESYRAEIESQTWDYSHVRKIAIILLGRGLSRKKVNTRTLYKTLHLLKKSGKAKLAWIKDEGERYERKPNDVLDQQESLTGTMIELLTSAGEKPRRTKLERLKYICTPHEKKLLGGVIDPNDLHTTFADVQAPAETIEALKTLTTLSLIRPESFSYGVLATDKIPGLLLYGPPGTGKTLLAKAVAKESGATVLEISASEINDMYVGEGEKNVKAVFSLAKKLSPCVVFIDEADALFGARAESNKRVSHREVINQFLREWDGMNDLSAFIMVATNRPFDIDEAVLRRLPRRLLVDLPTEKDREAILEIHLKGELLDESVSLTKLATNTPFYSGSDLKNLSVAAALACVREENDAAAQYRGDTPYVYPPKRTLRKEHFDKAMEEISASISEDMGTLAAIRKFDATYGDRKGRRKASALGFGATAEPEVDSDAGRVRKIALEV